MEFNSLNEIKKVYEEEGNLNLFNDFLYSATDVTFNKGNYETFLNQKYPFKRGEDKLNRDNYENLKKCTIDDFARYMSNLDDFDEIIKEYEYFIYGTTNIDDLVQFSKNCLYELIDNVAKDFYNGFEKVKKTYLDYFERYLGGNKYKTIQNNDNDEKINSPIKLNEMKDNIGDTHNINFKYDYEDRDCAFIYLDGEIIKGKIGQTHAQILENYMKQLDREEDIPEDYKDGGDIECSRPSNDRINRLLGTKNNAYGNIIDNIALIEVLEDVSEQEVANACKKQLKVDKVYIVSRKQNTDVVKRLAKIIRMDV